MTEGTPEHVFPRSIGGDGFVVRVHEECNDRANRTIDNHLVRCGHVRAARAAVGIRVPRGEGPYEEELLGETKMMVRPRRDSPGGDDDLFATFRDGDDISAPGVKVQLRVSKNVVTHVRVLPNPVAHPEGGLQSFTTDAVDASDEWSPDEFEPYTLLGLVAARRDCRHPQDLWTRFTAKAALGMLAALHGTDVVLEDGFLARESLTQNAYDALSHELRQLAFGHLPLHDVDAEPLRAAESEPAPRHIVGFVRSGQGALVILRLFDYLDYCLQVSSVELRHDIQMEMDLSDRAR